MNLNYLKVFVLGRKPTSVNSFLAILSQTKPAGRPCGKTSNSAPRQSMLLLLIRVSKWPKPSADSQSSRSWTGETSSVSFQFYIPNHSGVILYILSFKLSSNMCNYQDIQTLLLAMFLLLIFAGLFAQQHCNLLINEKIKINIKIITYCSTFF